MNTSDIKDFLRKHDVDNDVINNIKQGYKKQSLLLLVKNNLKNQGVTSKALQPLSIQELAKLLHLIQQFVAACNTTPTGHVNVGRSAPFTENQQETAEKENNHHLAETAITNPDIAPEITQKNTAHKRKKTETSCGDSVGRRKSSVPNNSSGSSSSSSSDSSSSSSDSSSSSSDSSTSSSSSSTSSSSNSSAWRSSKFPLIVNDCYDHLRQMLKNMKPSRKAIIYESFSYLQNHHDINIPGILLQTQKAQGQPHNSNGGNTMNSNDVLDLNNASLTTFVEAVQELLSIDLPTDHKGIMDAHVNFCRVAICFVTFLLWLRLKQKDVQMTPEQYKHHYVTMFNGRKLSLDEFELRLKMFTCHLDFSKFPSKVNCPQDVSKLLKVVMMDRKWSTTVTDKIKYPVWNTGDEYNSYPSGKKGLHAGQKRFLVKLGFIRE